MKDHFVSTEMILRAQQLRKDLGFTYQNIVDESEIIGHPVSMSTVRRFFAEDATKHKFAVDTVQGIFSVLGQTHDKTEGMTTPEQTDFLKDIIAFDRKLIDELDEKIAAMKAQHETEIKTMRCAHSEEIYRIATENQKRLDFIKTTVEDFKRQIEVKDRRMDERDRFFMDQIGVKDRRFDDLSAKYDRLLDKLLPGEKE